MIYISDNVKKWLFMIAGIICIASVFCITALFRGAFAPREEIIPVSPVLQASEPALAAPKPEPEIWAVYVTGEVLRPGVYAIEPDSRIDDAIRLAGGFTRLADREAVNLAEKLRDEAHISVPSAAARDDGIKPAPPAAPQAAQPTATQAPKQAAVKPSAAPAVSYPNGSNAEEDTHKIDINTADASLFTTLPGIGPKLSRAIVAHRDENGPFGDIEGLRNVGGIGEKRFEAIKELVKTGNP
ncbi:MAG: ComEA family DNA-binding protein [Synergistaceae bacterium]|jgi:competence protein ComEA|nr:ComEA family DNA-binding protein [Synergistaceae bacterium]